MQKLVSDNLLNENVVSDEEAGESVESAVELKRLETARERKRM